MPLMMDLFLQRTNRQLLKNDQKYVSVSELASSTQRLRACFQGCILPFPEPGVADVWRDVPNTTMAALPSSMRTRLTVLRAPPPTPTVFTSDTDYTPDDSSLVENLDGLPVVEATDHPVTSDTVETSPLESHAATEDDSMSRCSYSDQLSDTQVEEEEDSSQSIDNDCSSDSDSHLSYGRSSPTPAGFYSMVTQWLLVYHIRGTDAFLESLIVFATMSVASAPLASRIARDVIVDVAKSSYREGKSLERAVRCSALAAFKKHWESNETADSVEFPTPYGINIASFMGSLFGVKISGGKDVFLCLSILSEGEKRLDRLCAIHALLVQANDRLCKNRHLPALRKFKEDITAADEGSGEFLWAATARSKLILADILATIERWMLAQACKREQRWMYYSDHRTIHRRTMGPRFLYNRRGLEHDVSGHVSFGQSWYNHTALTITNPTPSRFMEGHNDR